MKLFVVKTKRTLFCKVNEIIWLAELLNFDTWKEYKQLSIHWRQPKRFVARNKFSQYNATSFLEYYWFIVAQIRDITQS